MMSEPPWISWGGSRFGGPAWSRQAAMLARASASRSVGCQVRPGSAVLNQTACSPVPLATSRTSARGGSRSRSTARMGSRFRAAAGAVLAAGIRAKALR